MSEENRKVNERDLEFLRRAISLAEEAKNSGVHPFAALVVDKYGRVAAEALNNALPPAGDPTQHAELRAAALAAGKLSPAELAECTLYASAEPCAMCAGAIYWCGLGRVVYGLSEARLLSLTGNHPENPTLSLPCRRVFEAGQRAVEVAGPLLEEEAAEAHKGSWEKK